MKINKMLLIALIPFLFAFKNMQVEKRTFITPVQEISTSANIATVFMQVTPTWWDNIVNWLKNLFGIDTCQIDGNGNGGGTDPSDYKFAQHECVVYEAGVAYPALLCRPDGIGCSKEFECTKTP